MAFNLGKVKDIYKLQKEARAMQKKMKALIIEGESKDGDVVVRINGTNELVDMDIEDSLLSSDNKLSLIKDIKQALKVANKKLQREMMKDMDMDKMRGMLGV
ncbi:YbaB/EbfC family nucleoid-associated protein [Candidatus Dojkabacteria bacterium]|nr:YbaB/EbfC family nucleoid-associated protein [Candidatus Dojkabacteria bacterium]